VANRVRLITDKKNRFMRTLNVITSYLPAVRYGGPIFATHGLCKALGVLCEYGRCVRSGSFTTLPACIRADFGVELLELDYISPIGERPQRPYLS
jgi:hypothetical protein